MAAQQGKALLVKLGDAADPEVFTTVGGLRSTSISSNNELVDITNKDSASAREILAAAGVNSLSISGSGVFVDSVTDVALRAKLGASTFSNYQLIVPALGTYEGAFQLTSLEYAGEYNGEATYSITLESSGAVAFTPITG